MIARKTLATKLESMNRNDVLVSQRDYHHSHHMSALPLPKMLAELVGAKKIEARTYTNKRGATHQSPVWLVEAYKALASLIYSGYDINVRMFLSIISK